MFEEMFVKIPDKLPKAEQVGSTKALALSPIASSLGEDTSPELSMEAQAPLPPQLTPIHWLDGPLAHIHHTKK